MAIGYVSVLLSFLCLNSAIRTRVSALLKGSTLEQLLDAVEEFLQYHKQIDQDIYLGEDFEDSRAGFVGRLQGLIDELKR